MFEVYIRRESQWFQVDCKGRLHPAPHAPQRLISPHMGLTIKRDLGNPKIRLVPYSTFGYLRLGEDVPLTRDGVVGLTTHQLTIGPRVGDDGAQYLMLSPESWPMNKSTVWLEDVASDLARFGASKKTRVSTQLTATRKSRLLAVREQGDFITLVWRC